METGKVLLNYLLISIFFFVFSLLVSACGAKPDAETEPSPEWHPEEETVKKPTVISPEDAKTAVLPDMAGGYELKGEGSEFPYWIGYSDSGKSEPGGYIFTARGKGFVSKIETMVGVNTEGTIVGVKVLFHEETEGYGDRLEEIREGDSEPWFTHQFIGKSASDTIALTEDGGDIDAISEATVSSRAFTESIDSGLKKLVEILGGAKE